MPARVAYSICAWVTIAKRQFAGAQAWAPGQKTLRL
jgi:hypothetical protein